MNSNKKLLKYKRDFPTLIYEQTKKNINIKNSKILITTKYPLTQVLNNQKLSIITPAMGLK